jgi:hypothetical protein
LVSDDVVHGLVSEIVWDEVGKLPEMDGIILVSVILDLKAGEMLHSNYPLTVPSRFRMSLSGSNSSSSGFVQGTVSLAITTMRSRAKIISPEAVLLEIRGQLYG